MIATPDSSWVEALRQRAQRLLAAWQPEALPGPRRLTVAELATLIDHTQLKPEATPAMIAQLCEEARAHHFASVCVNPCYVAQARRALEGSGVPVCSVVGFPLGATPTEVKVFETERALIDGAREIDMVIQIGALKGGDYAWVQRDIVAVVEASHRGQALCKVIIEAALLSNEEKVLACLLAVEAGADFCKTSTGFGPGGATVADVALMRRTIGPEVGLKAAGGIRSYAAACAMIGAGATRLGASASLKLLEEAAAAEGQQG